MELYTSNGAPVVFSNTNTISKGEAKYKSCSPRQEKHLNLGTVVVEKNNGTIDIISGIHATAILLKARFGDYLHKVHWPEVNKRGKLVNRRNGHDPHLVAVISNFEGNLFLKKGQDAQKIFDGIIPEGYEVEFIPPQKRKK